MFRGAPAKPHNSPLFALFVLLSSFLRDRHFFFEPLTSARLQSLTSHFSVQRRNRGTHVMLLENTQSPRMCIKHEDGTVEIYELENLLSLDALVALAASPQASLRVSLNSHTKLRLPLAPQLPQWDGRGPAGYAQAVAMAFPCVEPDPSSSTTLTGTTDDEAETEEEAALDLKQCPSTRTKRKRLQIKVAWTREEDAAIEVGVRRFGCKWSRIAEVLPAGRTDDSVRNRWKRLQLKHQRKFIVQNRLVRRAAGSHSPILPPLHADGLNGLFADSADDPDDRRLVVASGAADDGDDATGVAGKHGDMWTAEEDRIIDHAACVQGLRWKAIAAILPGRTDSGCRNRWVRNHQRILASRGTPVKGAAGVFAALRASDESRTEPAAPNAPSLPLFYAQPVASW